MEKPTFRTIREIIEAAGGMVTVSEACELSPDAVRKWPQNGIPDRYWSEIIPLATSCPEEIFAANEAARAEKAA